MRLGRLFTLLLLLNIVNYLDRNITSGVLPLLKDHFHATDTALGALGTAFMLTYALTALPFGIWADRWQPHKVAAIGVGIWSLATVLSAFAWSMTSLFAFRALVGVGEAAYVATASTILSGHFPKERRSLVLGLFNLGMPIGGAAGVVLGGIVGVAAGWQLAFALVGLPGLILAFLTWRLPIRNKQLATALPLAPAPALAPTPKAPDSVDPLSGAHSTGSSLAVIAGLLRNRAYLCACLGYAGVSYTFGAIVLFGPSLLERHFGYTVDQAGTVSGAIQVTAGLLGAPLGGWISDLWKRRNPHGRIYTLTLAMGLSAAFLFAGLHWNNLVCFFFATFFALWHVGTAAALVFDVTEKPYWNTAQSMALLLMHLLGDIPSSVATGYISDRSSLHYSMTLLPIPLLLAALFFLGARPGQTRKSMTISIKPPSPPTGSPS